MRKIRSSEQQIMHAIKKPKAGLPVKEICWDLGISVATFYQWRSKYSVMEASDLKRLNELEEDNRRLKQMYADLSLDHAIVRTLLKKAVTPAQGRELAEYAIEAHQVSIRRASRCVGIDRNSLYYQLKWRSDREIIDLLSTLSDQHPDTVSISCSRRPVQRATAGITNGPIEFTAR